MRGHAGLFGAIVAGVPPIQGDRGNRDRAVAIRHDREAARAGALQPFAAVVGRILRPVGIHPCPGDRRQFRFRQRVGGLAGRTDAERDGQRRRGIQLAIRRQAGQLQLHVARGQPWLARTRRFGSRVDARRRRRRADRPAESLQRRIRQGVRIVEPRIGKPRIESLSLEHRPLHRDRSAALRDQGPTPFDDLVGETVALGDVTMVAVERDQARAARARIAQRAIHARQVEQAHRVHGLLADVRRTRLHVRFHEHRIARLAGAATGCRADVQRQRLRGAAADVQRGDRQGPGVQRFQRNAELRGAGGLAINDLHAAGARGAEHLEILLQRRQLGTAERPVGLDVERDGVAQADVAAVEERVRPLSRACRRSGGLRQRRQQGQQHEPPAPHRHCPFSCDCPPLRRSHSSRNLRRSKAPGSSGTDRSSARWLASKRGFSSASD